MSNKIYLTLSPEYVQDWHFWEGMRELLQNMSDCTNYKFGRFHDRELRWVSLQSYDGVIPQSTLLLGNSGKRDDNTSVGKFGEGYKLAFLVLARLGYSIRIKNGFDKWIVSFEEHPQLKSKCLCVDVVEGFYGIEDTDGNTVDITVHGLSQEDMETLEENYLTQEYFDELQEDGDVLLNHAGNQIFRYENTVYEDERESLEDVDAVKKVFVNGLYVCDLPKEYVFSYNLTPCRITLDRDRKSVDSWDMQREVASLLEDAGEFALMVQMSEEKVPDLFSYYTPSLYKSHTTHEGKTESVAKVLQDLSLEKFKSKHGEDAVALDIDMSQVKRDVLKSRARMTGVKLIEVPNTYYKLLPDSVKSLPVVAYHEKKTPAKVMQEYLDVNKKHMRSKAIKNLHKVIEDLILQQ